MESRFWRSAFLALLVLECSPFLVNRYFPSQDGPSHLHNASVLAHYGSELIYRQYYSIAPLQVSGNMLTQLILATLLKFTEPLLAERLLLIGYVILLFMSVRYLLNALTPYADYFSLFAGILVSNYFLYMGFWNFSYSVCLMLFTLGYYVRRQHRWELRSLTVLAFGGLIVYLAHSVSWVVCVVAVAILGLPQPISAIRRRRARPQVVSVRSAILQYALPLSSLLPPAFFALIYLARSQGRMAGAAVDEPSWGERLWPLYSLSFLHTIAGSDLILAKAVASILFIAFLTAVGGVLWRRQYDWRGTSVLVLSLVFAVIAVVAPDAVGSGAYIHGRVALYAWLFLVVWLALQSWPRWALNIFAALFCGTAVIGLAVRVPVLSRWNEDLSSFAAVGRNIRPGSTVLRLSLGSLAKGVDPYKHAAGILPSRAIINLSNYEASTDYFSTRFRPERCPFPALGTLAELGAAPPVFDIVRYERETQGRVDYILFQGGADSERNGMDPLEVTLYGDQIAGYTLVSSGQRGNVRLYQRNSTGPNGGAGASKN
jgi:hypothetical protein